MESIELIAAFTDAGKRLDIFLSEKLSNYSRSFFKNLIEQGLIRVNQQANIKSGYALKAGDHIIINFPRIEPVKQIKEVVNLPVKIIYEHSDFIIIYKPAGLVVHAPQHNFTGVTLVDWLINYFHEIKTVGSLERPGIVHRLDLQTSGLMIVPRNNQAHALFTNMFKDRQVHKTYLALINGHPERTGQIDYHIVRHPAARNKMTHVRKIDLTQNWARRARQAQTGYEVLDYFENYTLVALKPITGRTHQIRVHMAAIGHPLIGDTIYGDKTNFIARQALHAYRLTFNYQGQDFDFTSELPADMQHLINIAKKIS